MKRREFVRHLEAHGCPVMAGGRVLTLHQREHLAARLGAAATSPGLPHEVLLEAVPPGEERGSALLSMPAGPDLAGWRLVLALRDSSLFDAAFREVPAATIVEEAALAVRKRFDTPGCRFHVNTHAALPTVAADADAMVTALVNLLDNAWKYSGEQKEITLAAEARNDAVCFKVTDDGIGLSPRDGQRIFQRFYRVNRHLAQTSAGCGLGLSIVQFIVSAHKGTVSVESQPEHGSTFTITLPVKGECRGQELRP